MRRSNLITAIVPLISLAVMACATPHDTSKGYEWGRARLAQDDGGRLRRCTEDFLAIDEAVERAGTRDNQSAPIPGFPYLRTTRFLAALGPDVAKPGQAGNDAFRYWMAWLASEAVKARRYEVSNMSRPERETLKAQLGRPPATVIDDCTVVLESFDMAHAGTREALVATVHVPDHYDDIYRVIGLYPLTSIPVRFGFERWKDRNLPSFTEPPSKLSTQGSVVRVTPAAEAPMGTDAVAALLQRSADNPLNVPRPSAAEFRRLAETFAPVFAIDVTGRHDRIGVPTFSPDGTPDIDTGIVRAFVQPSWTLFGGVPLLQISFLVWFTERPPTSGLDLLAGRLDGVIWRVTIGRDGRPLIYDSIHPCGCYHLFFPAPPTRLKDRPVDEPGEGTVVPIDAPVLGPGQRMVLHIGSGDHYLRALSTTPADTGAATRYDFASMDALRSLPSPNGNRSLYDRHGIISGTDRAERYLLWPMGIRSAGAMRQWGTHATAFVGRRHFDDPFLIDKAFTR